MVGSGGGIPDNLWSGEFVVEKTTGRARRGLGANYYACLSEKDQEAFAYEGQVVAVRKLETNEPLRGEGRPPEMRARCRLSKFQGPRPARGRIQLDQTVRNALGIREEPSEDDSVDIIPLGHSRLRTFGERLLDRALRRRYLFMRVCKADPRDMEKRMVRIPRDSFRLLGVSSGEKILISHPRRDQPDEPFKERRCALQAYPVIPEIPERQARPGLSRGLYDRYPDSDALLGVDPDLGAIYLDQTARNTLGVRTLEVVRVRRADSDAFMQQIRSFGLATAAGAITIVGVFGLGKSFGTGMIVLGISLVVAAIFSIFNLRASSYGTAD